MKSIYWNPRRVSLRSLLAVCLLSLGGVAASEFCPPDPNAPLLEQKLEAARLADRAMTQIKVERLRRGHRIDPKIDPAESGLIGEFLTPVTSVSGHLESKQTSVNPNFAAAAVEMLHLAGVRRGDVVAVGCSGSFPALNLCVCAALQAMQAEPIIISSVAGSQFGANVPDFLWIDMERHLYEQETISFRSVAASYGGFEDRALRMEPEGRRLLGEAISRNELVLIESDSFDESLETRMRVYRHYAGRRPVKAYVNVGGGAVSVGHSKGKKLYQPGLNLSASPQALRVDSVMTRFMKQGVPVVHLVYIKDLAGEFGFPIAPAETPRPGEGAVFRRYGRNRWMAAVAFGAVVVALVMSTRGLPRRPRLKRTGLLVPAVPRGYGCNKRSPIHHP